MGFSVRTLATQAKLALGCALALVGACFTEEAASTSTSNTMAPTGTTSDSPSTSGSVGTGADATTSSGADTASDGNNQDTGVSCQPSTGMFDATADAHVTSGDCWGANYAGGHGHVTLSPTFRGLFRFDLDGDVVRAWEQERITGLQLVLHRTDVCEGASCGPSSAGTIVARPLRVEWDEGPADFVGHEGADWCRRTAASNGALPWGNDGASQPNVDVEEPSGQVTIASGDAMATIDLDPQRHLPLLDITGNRVAIALWAEQMDQSLYFTARSHEVSSRAEPASQLIVTYCD